MCYPSQSENIGLTILGIYRAHSSIRLNKLFIEFKTKFKKGPVIFHRAFQYSGGFYDMGIDLEVNLPLSTSIENFRFAS